MIQPWCRRRIQTAWWTITPKDQKAAGFEQSKTGRIPFVFVHKSRKTADAQLEIAFDEWRGQ